MPAKKPYLPLSIILVLLLCLAQITGRIILIVPCLAAFLFLVGWGCWNNFTLPILLFFLPWSPILKFDASSHSFFTFGIVLVCAISVIKKRFHFQKYPIVAGVALLILTLISKVMDNYGLSFDYIAFMMLIIIFPVVKGEWTVKKYNFFQVVSFFALGVIIAAFCAQSFAGFPNIARFIRVDSYLTITRRSGFYGDANFYTAQITAAMGGCFAMILREKKRGHTVFLGVMLFALLYCGLLSASKSFVLVFLCMAVLWLIAFLRLKGRVGLKLILIVSAVCIVAYVATSAVFSGLIDVVMTRFSFTRDLDSFTTGRVELWISYLEEIMGNAKVFFLGKGFTNVKINGRSSHNTILQAMFQFGFVGLPFVIYWIASFFRGARIRGIRKRIPGWEMAMIAVGAFMPWLAIDAMFFDEFFLLQWYVFSALQQFQHENIT